MHPRSAGRTSARRHVRSAAVLCIVWISTTAPAGASIIERRSASELVAQADLVFEGAVVDVTSRVSDVAGPEHVALPHTYVTYQVDRVLKGTYDDPTLTLRMLGGPNGKGLTLHVAGIPRFRVGDRDILFVRDNGAAMCPLVGWEQGRLRLVRGDVFDDHGNEVWVTPDGDFFFGVAAIDVSDGAYAGLPTPTRTGAPEADHPPPPGSARPDASGMRGVLREMIQRQAAVEGEGNAKPVRTVSPAEPVFFAAPIAVPPPPDPVESADGIETNEHEGKER